MTALLVADGGPAIAQRYLDHGYVVQTRRLFAYMDAHGVGPVSLTELAQRSEEAASLEERHEIAGAGSRSNSIH